MRSGGMRLLDFVFLWMMWLVGFGVDMTVALAMGSTSLALSTQSFSEVSLAGEHAVDTTYRKSQPCWKIKETF